MITAELRASVTAWVAEDPEPAHVASLQALLDASDAAGLHALFDQPLQFGTAGLRGPLGPGPASMNRATVRRTAAALCRWLEQRGTDGPVVVGRDARHGSAEFALDTAAVVAATGRRVFLATAPVPTPLLAYAVRVLDAAAGVMVTASHNPPADNGYKVYAEDGGQIIPPMDTEIAALVPAVGALASVPMVDPSSSPLVGAWPESVRRGYLDEVAAVRLEPMAPPVTVAYTPMHGVGRPVLEEAFARCGLRAPQVVDEQAEPDPDFPTVVFPNPEEPGAMDLLCALASDIGADLALANDPDADRLGAAVPAGDGWRVLSGDEIGVLLADHVLRRTTGADRLVASSVVSSTMLEALAEAHGIVHRTTLTGFKWLARAGDDHPHLRLLLAYEEALGFAVSTAVRDKDGISAAVLLTEISATLARDGSSIPERLAELAVEFGLHRTRQSSRRFDGPGGAAAMAAAVAALRTTPPQELGGVVVARLTDLAAGGELPPTDGVVLEGDGLRVVVRPSGTEPKLKRYIEVVLPVDRVEDVPAATTAADAVIDAVIADLDR